MAGINYANRYKNRAKFTVATSEMFSRALANKNPKRPFPVPQADLNFLDPNSPLFYTPYALYSAGQAAKSDTAALKRDCMFTMRDRSSSVIIGDSGGYQIQTTAIKWEGDRTRQRMLTWLEEVADQAMILDFPTGGVNIGNVDPHLKRLIAEGNDIGQFCQSLGFDPNDQQKLAFSVCLFQTLQNNDYFVDHRRPGKTNLLNVLQGRNVEESDVWYSKVRHYPFEGWAMAGPHKENFEMTMRRFIMMADDGLLQNKDWIHFLGVGKLHSSVVYTTMQRAIQESINPNLTISFDVSSPFTLAAYGKCFWSRKIDKSGWSISGDKVENRNGLPGGPEAKRPFLDFLRELWIKKSSKSDEGDGVFTETEVGKRLTLDQVMVNADLRFTSSWDVVTYALLMHHNLQVHLEALFAAADAFDNEDSQHVPHGLLVLKDLIPRIFKSENPMDMIVKNRKALNYLAGDNAERGIQDLSSFDLPSISSHLAALERLEENSKSTATTPDIQDLSHFVMQPMSDHKEALAKFAQGNKMNSTKLRSKQNVFVK